MTEMEDTEHVALAPVLIGGVRRKSVSVSPDSLIRTHYLQPGRLPLVVEPALEGVDLLAWAQAHRPFIETELLRHGGILFRNFNLSSAVELERFVEIVSDGQLLNYSYGSSPRSLVKGRIYTSTEYPADQVIPLHNEMAYASEWPLIICFFCARPAEAGGETPIADSRKVLAGIAPEIREKFIQKGVLYVRNYGDGLDLPWQSVFERTEKSAVEDYCRSTGLVFEWKVGDRLKTSQVCQAVARHPNTGESVWFNQAHLFHISSLEPVVRESLLAKFEPAELPRNAYYGDGSPIEAAVLDYVRQAYQSETILFPWQERDLLMLDNMLTAHGRRPFAGSRRILVGMAKPFSQGGRERR